MWPLFGRQKVTAPAKAQDSQHETNKRNLRRIKMLLIVSCQSREHQDPFQIMTDNVNVHGIKFVSTKKLFASEIISMKILLRSHFPTISAKGRVVWCDSRMMRGKSLYEGGIEFISISDEDARFFEKFIDKFGLGGFDPENTLF
ncbi:MAG: PilZ domain-containing protein [Candidatus Eremiobacteraeota bacterium]|nr:PilZ domain-containing protein [Candidatus Eremiobacteraeota bacterium]